MRDLGGEPLQLGLGRLLVELGDVGAAARFLAVTPRPPR